MTFQYFSETDMLYISLSDGPSIDSVEVSTGVVLDYDEQGHVVGIEFEGASTTIDLSRLELSALPIVELILNRSSPAAA